MPWLASNSQAGSTIASAPVLCLLRPITRIMELIELKLEVDSYSFQPSAGFSGGFAAGALAVAFAFAFRSASAC